MLKDTRPASDTPYYFADDANAVVQWDFKTEPTQPLRPPLPLN